MDEKPPIDPSQKKLMFASVGLTDEKAVKQAMKGYKQLIAEIADLPRNPKPTYQTVQTIVEKYPPEVKSLLLMKQLVGLGEAIVSWKEWTHNLITTIPEADEAKVRQAFADALQIALVPIREVGRVVIPQTLQRAAEGWPEWQGVSTPAASPVASPVVSTKPSQQEMSAAIDNFLAGILDQEGDA